LAGFTFNGCGASDSYYPLWQLGEHYCPVCNAQKPFSVMELRMKIRVFFIPTVTVNTKYAVACNKCKNGYYIDENQKNDIISGRATVEIKKDGAEVIAVDKKSTEEKTETVVKEEIKEEIKEEVKNTVKEEIKEITAEQQPSEKVVEAPFPEETSPVKVEEKRENIEFTMPVQRKIKQCPKCRLMYSMTKEVCTICNCALENKE